jgi:RHS repeat-associated protein
MAATNLPQAVAGNTFNAANEMTSFNGTPMTYDANGNLTNDGTNTYAWDARNHLVGISGGSTASFVYDADGRRALKSINGTTTQFLYDGLNPVQELQNGAPSANMLTGLGIDEFFQRTDSAGVRDYLSDILGSTLALTDSSGTKQTSYLYNPFGTTTASSQGSSNPYQFTGRENDGTGLDYYRARYYSPALQRFIAQDPLNFGGGDFNLYGYVSNDPMSSFDPEGLAGNKPDRFRQCNAIEQQDCKDICGDKGVESCVVAQTITKLLGLTKSGKPRWGWHDAPMSCSCNEPQENSCKAKAMGIGAGILLGIDLLSRLFPPRNLVPVP